jgi:hypothetical protein
MTLRKNRLVYASLLQLEYVLALITGVLLGSEKWLMFGISLVLCLLLGFVTTWLYWNLMDEANGKKD